MKMKLKDHEQIGQVVLKHVDSMRFVCCSYAKLALKEPFNDVSVGAVICFKAYMLMLGALEDLCREYDFDVICGEGCEND